ncbi:uncharacterized protein GGS22DRAFT_175449 [Annulohypoxylon maeteangense]|uniref:uncharacterized protein n=1 Tax=Annulohypoxylon maeteangense TaxID=1927788 RepID=UPI0020087554|nr:uncharacterized protein GGS22DRAFT_175449 [Annulohypoxylon maeteangense]KAI0880217.1 hypothetical protein GGS22DRAFT_175449 [Annulohypoxylon maeteangense]
MPPPGLVSSYQQYKEDTDSIAAWLASTAKSCGYPSDLLINGPTIKATSARLKGKARAEAKKKPSTTKPSPAHKYIIKIKDFVPLAEFVASKRDVSISNSFMATLRRVIIARGGFGEKLAEQGSVPDELSDAKHGYFVGILEKVFEVLKPRVKTKETAPSPVPSSDEPGVSDFVNQFASLQVYEPSDDFLNAPDLERPKPLEGDKIAYEAEPADSLEDLFVALTMLINDVNKIRSRIEWIWTNYRDGFFDLAAAAVATNTAIDLARHLTDDVEPLFKDHGGLWKVLNKWYLVQMLMKGYDVSDIFNEDSADNFNYDTYDIADGTYILTCRLVSAFIPVIQPDNIPLYKDGMFGYYDPQSDRASKTGYQKFEEDRILLMTIFGEHMAVVRGVANYPVEDEFLRGIQELTNTREISFCLVFAAQIFLDIHYILREHAGKCLETLQKNLKFFDREIEEYFKFHKNLKIENWPASNDHMLREYQRKIKWVLDDPGYKVKAKAYEKLSGHAPLSMEKNLLLKTSPILSGLMLYHFRSEIWDIGIALANAWGSITYSLHLYNALRSANLLTRTWKDMDLVRTLLGDSSFFVGDAPKTLSQSMKKFCLQMGTTMAVFTNKRRGKVSLESRAGPRGIKDGAPVSSMFMDRYLRGKGQVDWSPEHVAKIVDLGLWETEGSEEEGTLMLGQIDDPEKIKQKAKAKHGKGSEKTNLSPDQLIRALMFSLQGETLELSLPYISMHRECWSFLRAVQKHCDPLLRQIYTAAYIEREAQLCWVVGWIFFEHLKVGTATLLVEAQGTVDEFIRTEGTTVLGLLDKLGMPIEFKTQGGAQTA